jgi:hypothetical protein
MKRDIGPSTFPITPAHKIVNFLERFNNWPMDRSMILQCIRGTSSVQPRRVGLQHFVDSATPPLTVAKRLENLMIICKQTKCIRVLLLCFWVLKRYLEITKVFFNLSH